MQEKGLFTFKPNTSSTDRRESNGWLVQNERVAMVRKRKVVSTQTDANSKIASTQMDANSKIASTQTAIASTQTAIASTQTAIASTQKDANSSEIGSEQGFQDRSILVNDYLTTFKEANREGRTYTFYLGSWALKEGDRDAIASSCAENGGAAPKPPEFSADGTHIQEKPLEPSTSVMKPLQTSTEDKESREGLKPSSCYYETLEKLKAKVEMPKQSNLIQRPTEIDVAEVERKLAMERPPKNRST